MSIYSQASEADRKRIRRKLLAQVVKILPPHLKHTARSLVDMALAKEKHEQNDSSDTKQPA